MEWIMDNWMVVVALAAGAICAVLWLWRWLTQPAEAQLAKVRQWLLWAVVGAEQSLGGGTGRLKLRQVYDLFVVRFPWLVSKVSFALFSDLVDDALEEMRALLASNSNVKRLVEGGEENE